LDKIAMLSVVLATLAIPAAFARETDPRRAARRMVLVLLVVNALYVAYVTQIHTTLYRPPPWPWP
jgi:hypothetical protein